MFDVSLDFFWGALLNKLEKLKKKKKEEEKKLKIMDDL